MAHFPRLLRDLPKFAGPFDAFKLEAKDCDVLFASYPAGTSIAAHDHETENVGVITQGELILTLEGEEHRYGRGDWYHVRPVRSMRLDSKRGPLKLNSGSINLVRMRPDPAFARTRRFVASPSGCRWRRTFNLGVRRPLSPAPCNPIETLMATQV